MLSQFTGTALLIVSPSTSTAQIWISRRRFRTDFSSIFQKAVQIGYLRFPVGQAPLSSESVRHHVGSWFFLGLAFSQRVRAQLLSARYINEYEDFLHLDGQTLLSYPPGSIYHTFGDIYAEYSDLFLPACSG